MPGRRAKAPSEPELEFVASSVGFSVPLYWVMPDELHSLFANHILVRMQDGLFVVIFGEAHLPPEVQLDRAKLEKEGLPVQAIARLIITPERMRLFLEAMQKVYETAQPPSSRSSKPSSKESP